MLNIKPEHIESKKKIGMLKGKAVIELKTTGGFHMVVSSTDGGGFETLGTGPHKAIARHIAQKREPEIQWTELSKADYVPVEHYEHLLPEYEVVTDRVRELQKGEVIQGNFQQHKPNPEVQGPTAPVIDLVDLKDPLCKCGQFKWNRKVMARSPHPHNIPKSICDGVVHSPERCGPPTIQDL